MVRSDLDSYNNLRFSKTKLNVINSERAVQCIFLFGFLLGSVFRGAVFHVFELDCVAVNLYAS